MKQYIFLHGKNATLSQAELSSIFHEEVIFQMQDFTVVETNRQIDQRFQNRLGGTIKIAEVIDADPVELILQAAQTDKILFAVSQYGGHERLSEVLLEIKKALRKRGHNARFLNKDFSNVSSALLNKSRLLEKGVDLVRCFYEGQERWARTIAFQDIDAYSKRDYEKPKRDMKVGMMPPKLCQILINLARPLEGATIYDPFCGLGGVLMEAALMGYPVMGSDIKGRLIDSTLKNLQWLQREFSLPGSPALDDDHFFQHDATQAFSAKKYPDQLTMVTEGYLGPPQEHFPDSSKQKETFTLLHRINAAFFSGAAELLASGQKLVICLPYYRSKKGHAFYPDEHVQEYAKAGFELQHKRGSLLYERKSQVVGREITVWKHL